MRTAPEVEAHASRHSAAVEPDTSIGSTLLRVTIVAATILYAVWFAVHYRAVYDPDIWWHLRIGDWVLQHRAVPHADWLSSSAQGRPWVAYSWGFEAIVAALNRGLGLFGPIIAYPVTMVLLIGAALWALLSELGLTFGKRALLAAGALVAMAPIFSPRPGLFSVLFFTLELWLLLRAERTQSAKPLYVLPLLFALWANIHIQFIYGLFVIGLYAAEPWIEKAIAVVIRSLSSLVIPSAARNPGFFSRTQEPRSLASLGMTRDRTWWLLAALCALSTLLNPYTYKLYVVIAELASQTAQYSYISELQSPSFRTYNSFAELFVILAAWLALGTRRAPRWMSAVLLLVATVFAFRTVRDVWFGVLAAVFVMGSSEAVNLRGDPRRNSFVIATTGAVVLIGVLVIGALHPLSNRELWQDTSEEFPVKAVEYVKQQNLKGPLYNDWYWGGFLTWSLPDVPVYVDSRTNLFGDRVLQRSIATWSGASDWGNDPALAEAGVIVANPDNALTSLLRFDPRFRVEYEDARAVVFVAAGK